MTRSASTRDGWRSVVARWRADARSVRDGMARHRTSLIAAGVAFYFFLALVPALVVVVTVYGLVASPADVRSAVDGALRAAPEQARELVIQQLREVISTSGGGSVVAGAVAAVVAIWSASSGMANLVAGIAVAFEREVRGSAVRRRVEAVALTLIALVLGATALFVIAFVPAVLADAGAPTALRWTVGVARWPVLGFGMVVALNWLYGRVASERLRPRRVASVGAVVAMLVWIVGSAAFAVYTANFSRYQGTYGSLGAIVVLLLWLLVTAASVLVGAEIDRARERAGESAS